MTGYNIIKLSDMLEKLEEDRVKSILLTYSCPKNKDIEFFLKEKAIVFDRQGIAKTHLVFASYKSKPVLIGYFALASKTIMINKGALSKTLRKRVVKFGSYYPELKKYLIGAPLIAEIGKNFTNGYSELISGDDLLKIACDKVQLIQSQIGGKIVYLECEDNEKLIEFYSSNGFINFGNRALDPDETDRIDGKYLVQMLKYLR